MTDKPGRARDHHRDSWPPIFQLLWDLLGDKKRLRRLVFMIAVVVVSLVVLKATYAGLYYELTQHVAGWVRVAIPTGAITASIAANFGLSRRRARRRAQRKAALPGKSVTAKAVAQKPRKKHKH